MSDIRPIDANALKERVNRTIDYAIDEFDKGYNIGIQKAVELIDNAPTVEITESEYGAIQYSNGFNDGFTTAKDTIIHNIVKQYSEHNELVPEWLSIADMKGGAE